MSFKTKLSGASVVAIGFAILCLWCTWSEAAQLPTLPQNSINTTYSPPTGNIITVNAGGNLQAALNSAALGDTIVLQAGATFTGPFTLPNKTTGSGWIYIVSSAYASLPAPGTRVGISDAANMPKIKVGASAGAAIQTAAAAHNFRFIGIEFLPASGAYIYAVVQIGNAETSTGNLPYNITFDRCLVHGDPTQGARRGIAMDGISIAVIDSYIYDIFQAGNETQALWAYNSPGPIKIVNNYLKATGENIMFGGADPAISGLVPSDITIQRNYFYKDPSWVGAGLVVKNLLEFKNAQRVLVEGNTFQNSMPDAQNGFGLLLTPRNQSGTAPQSRNWDITIRLNKMLAFSQGINLSGRDSGGSGGGLGPSQITQRVLIENNLFLVDANNGSSGRIFQVVNGPQNTTIRHNTAIITTSGTLGFSDNNPVADQFDFRDNVFSSGSYGFSGTGTGSGNSTLTTYYTNYTYTNNVHIADVVGSGSYPANNYFPANSAAVGFVNFAGGNYALTAGSPFRNAASDGTDPGANIAAITAAGNPSTIVIASPSNLQVQ